MEDEKTSEEISLADGELRKLQLLEYEMLKKIKEICEQNHITYYLSGGTLLGAVRHKGFIPWDDDVDVAMPRPDYERFIKIAEKEFHEPYALLTADTDSKYIFPFAKIINRSAKVKTTSRKNEQVWSVWVDVFPLDSMPKNKLHFKLRKFHVLYRRMMFLFSCFDDMVSLNKENRPFLERAMIFIGSKLHPDRFMNTGKQIKKFNKALMGYEYNKGYYIINLMGIYKFRSLMERDIYGKKTEIQFEDDTFRVPEQYIPYLEKIYGDYMKLPPVDKRNHHEIELISK